MRKFANAGNKSGKYYFYLHFSKKKTLFNERTLKCGYCNWTDRKLFFITKQNVN